LPLHIQSNPRTHASLLRLEDVWAPCPDIHPCARAKEKLRLQDAWAPCPGIHPFARAQEKNSLVSRRASNLKRNPSRTKMAKEPPLAQQMRVTNLLLSLLQALATATWLGRIASFNDGATE